jgi:predicted CXXCH cytochrome family protein
MAFKLEAVKIIAQRLVRASMAFACIVTTSAWAANGYVYDAVGDVSVGIRKDATHAVTKKDAIPSDSVINTGDKSYAVLKFKDGQTVTMQANTALHIKEYPYYSKKDGNVNIVISDFTGGMRINTGLIGQRNQKAFQLSTPNATIDIRGTEFMVATINNNLYGQVISGSVSMSNEAGVVAFNAGQTGLAASRNTLPLAIPANALPTGVFSQLEAIPTAPGAETGVATGGTATDASTTTISSPGMTAAINRDDNPKYFLCDFCTGQTHDATHIAATTDDAAGGSVTGDATMFGKHNLTPTGANTGEICAFCHTPQGSESNIESPQWNPSTPPLSSYRAFSTMGSATDEASGSISMACLSCHDGTQAPNIIINTPANKLDVPNGETVYIGRDLKNHHPVGMQYGGGGQNQYAPDIPLDPIAAYNRLVEFNSFTSLAGNKFTFLNRRGLFKSNDIAASHDIGSFSNEGKFDSLKGGFNKSTYSGTGNGTVWWIETANSKMGRQKTDLYLFTRTDKVDSIPSESTLNQPYVECATCHDPHSTNPTFLRLPGGNARSQVCLTCHNK